MSQSFGGVGTLPLKCSSDLICFELPSLDFMAHERGGKVIDEGLLGQQHHGRWLSGLSKKNLQRLSCPKP